MKTLGKMWAEYSASMVNSEVVKPESLDIMEVVFHTGALCFIQEMKRTPPHLQDERYRNLTTELNEFFINFYTKTMGEG